MVSILSRKGRCERASIDEVYLDLTEAAETMLAESPCESLEAIREEAYKSHILGLHLVQTSILVSLYYCFFVSFCPPTRRRGEGCHVHFAAR